MQAKLAANLSPAYDAAAIGYRIDNADNTVYAAFTQVDVSLLYSGYWDAAGLKTLPDTGGTVFWGISGTDYASVPFGPAIDAVLTVAHGSGDWTTADLTTLQASVDALPTASEIDTELTASHGAGSWVKAVAAAVVAACASTWSIWSSGRA